MIYFFIILLVHFLNGNFSPDTTDYNAYGLKIAMNEYLLVKIQNKGNIPTFFIQFAPYNDTSLSLKCSIFHPSTTDHYFYTVALGKNQTQIFFAGELINGSTIMFIGVVTYNNNSLTCNNNFKFFLQYISDYEHQEYYIIDIEPNGRFAYGFSNSFICIFDSENPFFLETWNGNLTWPDKSFMPHSVDLAENFGIIAGFIHNPQDSITRYIPIIYLINYNISNNHPIIIDEFKPDIIPNTWQNKLTDSDADIYSAKYDMSISINNNGNILIGMQFINQVILLSVNITEPNKLYFISRNTQGRSLGNGKSVAWMNNGIAAILVNTYTFTYQWSSSKIYFYDIENNGYYTNSSPLSVFPNNHQLLPLRFNTIFLNIISSPSSLALLDYNGNILIFNPTLPGYYPYIEDIGSLPVFTSPKPCLPGSYKNQTGIYDCILCPNGTKNSGNSSLQCISCLPESFCSIGSINEISQSALKTIIQIYSYPKSPESIIFDEILIQNMFNIGSNHCLYVSPLFWTLIVSSLVIIMIIIMGILKISINYPRSQKIRQRLKSIFKYIDLIGEGELWIGGLASLSIIVLVSFAYSFSSHFLTQYPIEKTSDSHFACDLSLRNAKFQTSIYSSSIPGTKEEEKMFDLLNNQIFYLNIDFINTLIDCNVITLQVLLDTKWSIIDWINCINNNSILSLSIQLPYQYIYVQIILDSEQIISALRIGLYSSGNETEHYNLKELNFYQSFFKYDQILSQNLLINLEITKVINETTSMFDEESDFSGIYIPTFIMNSNSLFLSKDQYVLSTSTLTTLTISLSETPYYVKNSQQPIAKRSEIIFHNLLFTTVCLEIFGLIFLLHKLIFKPLCYVIFPECFFNENENKLKRNKY